MRRGLGLLGSSAVLALAAGTAAAADAPPSGLPTPPPPVAPRTEEEVVIRGERYVIPADATVSTATRTSLADLAVPRATSTVTAADLFEQAPRTAPLALDLEPGVFVQQTNLGGGSPIVRGLTGEQVLLVMDGIRLNNATTRSGPTQYANLVDPYLLDRIEVVRGPSSVLYGSDALGGVVHFVPRRRDALTRCLDVTTLLAGNVSTATAGGTGTVRSEGSWRGLGWTGGVQAHDFDDVRVGDGGGDQEPTAYHGGAADLRLEAAPAPGQRVALAYQAHEDRDVPRTDAVESGANLEFEFDPQRRQLLYLDWRGAHPGAVLESWRLNGNLQRWDEGRYEVRANRPAVERHLYDRVDTWGVFGQVTLRLGCAHRVTAGFEWYHDEVTSRRRNYDRATDTWTRSQARYADGSTFSPFGVYVQDEWTPTPCGLVVAGLRYSRFDLHAAERTDTNPLIPSADAVNDELTGSLAASYEVARGVRAYASVAQGFRAPNVDDTTVFDRAASGVEVPNPDLEPEHVIAYELGCKVDRASWSGGLALWLSDFEDLIQRVPGTFLGSPTIDGLPVSTRENVADATMKGLEVWGERRFARDWRAYGSVSYVEGTNDETDQPLNKIPPWNGVVGARWTRCDGRFWVEPYVRWAARQIRLSEADKADFRVGPDGTPGWWTANVRVGVQVDRHLELVLEAGNLFDERFKHHGSGAEDPGRHLTLSVQAHF